MHIILIYYALTQRTPPLAQGYKVDNSYVINASGRDHRNGITENPIMAYKFPAAFIDGSTPNGPPART